MLIKSVRILQPAATIDRGKRKSNRMSTCYDVMIHSIEVESVFLLLLVDTSEGKLCKQSIFFSLKTSYIRTPVFNKSATHFVCFARYDLQWATATGGQGEPWPNHFANQKKNPVEKFKITSYKINSLFKH